MSVNTTPMTSSETRAMRGRLVRASGRFSAISFAADFEQAIGEPGVEHALIGDVAADVDEGDTHRVFAQRGHVERHAQGFFEAVAMRQHGAGALRI